MMQNTRDGIVQFVFCVMILWMCVSTVAMVEFHSRWVQTKYERDVAEYKLFRIQTELDVLKQRLSRKDEE